MHHVKEAGQNALVCILLFTNILINNFGSYLTSVSFLLAYVVSFVNYHSSASLSRGRGWVFAVEWLVLIRQVCLFSALCQGVTEILVLLSRPHPLDTFIPTFYLPKSIVSMFVVIIILILLCFGLEGSIILDGLMYGCISGAVALYTISTLAIHGSGHFVPAPPPPFDFNEILLVSSLVKPFFVETGFFVSSSRIWTNTFMAVTYFLTAILMPSYDDILCVEEGQMALLCPINAKFKWYEVSMSCLALIAFATLAPTLAIRPALSLVTPSRLGTHFSPESSSSLRKNNVKATIFLAIVTCLLTYWTRIYQLFFINAIICWLQELLCSISHLYYFYTPVYVRSDKRLSRSGRRSGSYVAVDGTGGDSRGGEVLGCGSFQDVTLTESDSSDTDIDSIVEEYHDKVKVLSGSGSAGSSPTELTGKVCYCCIIFLSGLSLCISLELTQRYYTIALYTTLGLMSVAVLLICLPRRNIADLKIAVILVLNLSVSNIMIVPLFNMCSVIITCIFIVAGLLLYLMPRVKSSVSMTRISVSIKSAATEALYSTQIFKVQRRAISIQT